MNKPREIIAHCAGTNVNGNFTHKDVYKWHVVENGWSEIGYHYIIEVDGTVIVCRPLHKNGAHCADNSMNDESIGICFMGGYRDNKKTKWDKPTCEQIESFLKLKDSLDVVYGIDFPVTPHSKYNKGKSCPNFDTKKIGF